MMLIAIESAVWNMLFLRFSQIEVSKYTIINVD